MEKLIVFIIILLSGTAFASDGIAIKDNSWRSSDNIELAIDSVDTGNVTQSGAQIHQLKSAAVNASGTVVNPATLDAQTDGSQKTQLVDGSGNVSHSTQDILGQWHSGVHIIQHALTSANNSSTTNLTAANSYSYTGTAESSTGANAIKVMLKTDVTCTVTVQQSSDGNNWDVSDDFVYLPFIDNFSTVVEIVGTYFRVLVVNTDQIDSTYLRLNTNITPVASAIPRTLDEDGHSVTSIHVIKDKYNFEVENTPNGEMRTVTPINVVGTEFEGTTIDSNFVSYTVTNGGTINQENSRMILNTNTTANGSALFYSKKRSRKIPSQTLNFRSECSISNVTNTDNTIKIGVAHGSSMPTITDGAYFKIEDSSMNVVLFKNGAETVISNGSFNGNIGATYSLDTDVHDYEIYWNNKDIWFVIDDTLLHNYQSYSDTWSQTMQLHTFFSNANTNDNTAENILYCRTASIKRLGSQSSQPTSYYQSGTTAGVVLKRGSGNLHSAIISGVVNNSVITLYDNTAASGTILWSSGAMGAQTQPFSLSFSNLPFSNGLTLVISAANSNILIVYE